MKFPSFFGFGLAALAAVLWNGPLAAQEEPSDRLKVVATFAVIGDWVSQVAGEEIDLVVLAGPGTDPHAYDPNPSEAQALSRADLTFEIGQEYEGWFPGLYDASGSGAGRVVLSEGLELREAGGAACCDGHDHDHAHKHDHDHHHHHHDGEYDPHVWTSVVLVREMVGKIRDALVEADPGNSAIYQANADAYLSVLQELDEWIRGQVATLPEEGRQLILQHDSFNYFAAEYGFETPASILGSLNTETADPSAQEMVELVKLIREKKIPALFSEVGSPDRLARQVASEAGIVLGRPLYSETLSGPGGEASTYEEMMRYNVISIVEALNE